MQGQACCLRLRVQNMPLERRPIELRFKMEVESQVRRHFMMDEIDRVLHQQRLVSCSQVTIGEREPGYAQYATRQGLQKTRVHVSEEIL